MPDVLPLIARHGLTHPRQSNRRMTLHALKRLDNPVAEEILRDVLAGAYEALPLGPGEAVEPGGMIRFRPEDSEAPGP